MSTSISVRYKRVGELYSGEQSVNGHVVDMFEDVTFAQQIRLLHLLLTKHPDAVVEMQRTDRAGLMPIYLDETMVQLIRDDPAKYIQAHTIPHRTVDLRQKSERTSKLAEKYEVPKATTIRAGHDTLKDSFGDVVYLNWRNDRVEDPATGRWRPWHEVAEDLGLTRIETFVSSASTAGMRAGWMTVSTSELLTNNSLSGFYLPRAWNEGGPWISRAALIEKYNKYLKEREQCLETTRAP